MLRYLNGSYFLQPAKRIVKSIYKPMLLSDFIDIHTHILPGVDDGPRTKEQSLAMAKNYTENGISFVIATPHYIPGTGWCLHKENIIKKVGELQEMLNEYSIPLKVFPGAEIAIHDHIQQSFDDNLLLPLANSSYYLLEPPFQDPQGKTSGILASLLDQGHKIILAHPERADFCQDSPGLLAQLVRNGLKIQLNFGSLLGKFGKRCYITAVELVNLQCVHFIGSDSHSITRRTPLTQYEWLQLQQLLEKETIKKLCIINPKKLLEKSSHHEPE